MSDAEEEDDYMSLKFLEGAEEFEAKRKETSYSERRKKQLREQEKKGYIKPRAQIEQEEREKGLQTAMDKDNKGMKMLMKMGFKQGMALGNKKDGIVEPIKVDLKTGRQGIGLESEMRKRLREEEEEAARKRVEIDPEDYRAIMANRAKDSQYLRYINAAVSICEKLDEENDIKSNILWILKPIQPSSAEDEAKEGEKEEKEAEEKEALYPEEEVEKLKSLKLQDQLEKLTSYLRDTYCYCFWCRTKYADKEDLGTNCPGPEEEDH